MKNFTYDRRTSVREKWCGVLKDTFTVGISYAAAVFLVGWILTKVVHG